MNGAQIFWSLGGGIGVLLVFVSAIALGRIQLYARQQVDLLREILNEVKNKT